MYMYILNEDIRQPELATKMNSNRKVHREYTVIINRASPPPRESSNNVALI